MIRAMKWLIATGLLAAGIAATAASVGASTLSDAVSVYGGANGVFFGSGDPWNADVEAAGNASISLSPHISAVGGLDYGFSHSYFRSAVGGRITATDTENPNFSVGLGIQYRSASVSALRPNEWAPDVTIGVKPWPEKWPSLLVGAQGWYGLDTQKAAAELAARWRFKF